ncbi:zinc finger protein 771 isoform X2 [Manduca sexta]|uniref:C2H2-type domain-containing protein n=2 Tax=Manduca sexta TaxID=7130 RepID=A0A922CSD1_MANSE|nr:zinc finger protein 771 isoform X2 [Manduca sexta]KAG6456306.1 hypothetical protein O3G_MSEX009668 [Manduca sexta]
MAETAAALHSPGHLHKRRRLSRLLDKLAVQLRNNNHYPPAQWLRIEAPAEASTADGASGSGSTATPGSGSTAAQPKSDEGPLDLSVKSEMPPPPPPPPRRAPEPSFACAACGQRFALHHRLAKHVASRHRSRATEPARVYECDVCSRKFARSDMLTRHARLHSGLKPYACAACGQVFSRSDHLATHQRTHTGEKPYRCPACPYAACRRDMITRHMRTHARRAQPV